MAKNIVEVKDLEKWFVLRGGFLDILRGKKTYVKAVDGVDFTIKEGEVLALVGESGCGKTTIGRVILNLTPKTGGKVVVNGIDLDSSQRDELKFRREIQIILQDPFGSLDPRMRVYDIIGESIHVHKLAKTKEEKNNLIIKSMETVNLVPVDDIIT
jgi:peptide/nickel transport system ATP-binding protein/oligopeptide transport system ATP-binding protein